MKNFFGAIVATLFLHPVLAQKKDSLDIKIGQMILIGFPGATVDDKVLEEVRQGKVGSIIVFEKNIPPQNSFIALKKLTWTYQHAAPIPLLIGIDQEGGRVNRLKDKYGFPKSITAEAMATSGTLDSVQFYGESTASTLAGLGININFAPVVDLASNPTNPIIAKFGRAFSANEDTVIFFAKEFIKQHHKMGVLTALKHFPGHGSSKDDTHLGVTDVTNTWQERELKPYQALIDSGYVDAVMTSHIVNKNLDKNGYPATLSADIITGILRNKLRFNGLIFSDDMQMFAIAKNYGLEQAIKLAIQAGVDIMIFSNNISGSETRTVDRVHQAIRSMVQRGEISQGRIDESFRRIMRLKKKLNQSNDFYREDFLRVQSELHRKEDFTRQKAELEKRLAEEWEKKKLEDQKKKKRKRKQKSES